MKYLLDAMKDIELWTRDHPNGTCEAVNQKAVDAMANAQSANDEVMEALKQLLAHCAHIQQIPARTILNGCL